MRSIIQDQIWESGYFISNQEGTKEYTFKLKFDYDTGEQKRLIYTLNPDKFLKGIYTMQVYHNGAMIGETNKKLI